MENSTSTPNCMERDTSSYQELRPNLTRRTFLRTAAVGLAVMGLGSQAQAAFAASSKVKAGNASEISVKGAKGYTLKGQYIIVTQPKKGTFKAFSGFCTHQRVQINAMNGTNLVCTRHGASYDTTTGKPTGGPAFNSLKTYPVTVTNGILYIPI